MMGLMIFSCTITGLLLLLFAHLLINLLSVRRLRTGLQKGTLDEPFVSLLVPARNEEASIEMCVYSLLKQRYERLEVLVLDDRSSDATASIVQRIIDALPLEQKERLQLFYGEPLPPGWVGKNFACHQLAQHARGAYLLFTDADTVHAPAMARSVIRAMRKYGVDLLTAQPAFQLGGLGERLVIPLLNFTILTLLPVALIPR